MRKTLFYVIVILQIVFLMAIAGSKWYTICFGKTVLLKTLPVDPRDLFRGDYVILRYEFSEIDLNKIPVLGSPDFKRYDIVYVKLRKVDQFWHFVAISRNKPALEEQDDVFIKGIVRNAYDKKLSVDYGIESFFVPEGKGREIEEARQAIAVTAEIAVDQSGDSAIRRIRVWGRAFDF
jgi:uncharacterized membrane-anchored protein